MQKKIDNEECPDCKGGWLKFFAQCPTCRKPIIKMIDCPECDAGRDERVVIGKLICPKCNGKKKIWVNISEKN